MGIDAREIHDIIEARKNQRIREICGDVIPELERMQNQAVIRADKLRKQINDIYTAAAHGDLDKLDELAMGYHNVK